MAEQQFPEPIVGVFILNQQGELLLLKSHKWKNVYTVPGGHIEVGEAIEETLKREVQEETGLTVFSPRFLTVKEYIAGEEFHKKKHFIFLNYSVKTNGEIVALNDEAEEYVWIAPSEALKLPMMETTKSVIQTYLI